MRHSSRVAGAIALYLTCLLFAACRPNAPLDADSVSAWSKVLVGHTSGVVSRRSEVRVVFASDIGSGKLPPPEALKIEPSIPGKLEFRGARELVFVPEAQLEPGRQYHVTLQPKGLAGMAAGLAPYQFDFRVQTPQYDLVLDDLASDPADDERMLLTGVIVTADMEESARVERMLTARYQQGTLNPAWTHTGDGREHRFTLPAVVRGADAEQIELAVDGKPIGAGREENRSVVVPVRAQFTVVNAVAVEDGGRREVRVTFSDLLDEGQDLNGLVLLSPGTFTSRIDENRLTLYPAEDLQGDLTVTLEPGIRNARGKRLEAQSVQQVSLTSEKPQLRFVGVGVILPDGKTLTVPFEVVSARSVRVTATRIFPENIPQFLQVNSLPGNEEIGRVGRYLWRKTVSLNGPVTGQWQRYEFDVSELLRRYPGSMFQLTIQLTPADSAYACAAGNSLPAAPAGADNPRDQEDGDVAMESSWDFAEDYFGVADDEDGTIDYESRWRDRKDPCKAAYFSYAREVRAQRNLLASDLGLLAKADAQGRLIISATSLRTAQSLGGVSLSLRNFQNQPVGNATTDSRGFATIQPQGTPFLLVASAGDQRGYLKLNAGKALPTSQFDAGGEIVAKGLKGTIYGERGVWRPGDPLHLNFVVFDRGGSLPADHPATLELLDPRGRSAQTLVNAKPVDGFYRFDLRTASDAPTGNWTARVSLGGATFRKTLKVETVMPNRLKIALQMPEGVLGAGELISGRIDSEWLSGASAAGLRTDVNLRLTPTVTKFDRFNDYSFDDPARDFRTEPEQLFEGELGSAGTVRFAKPLKLAGEPAGMLNAAFTTRVFERGGAFSINHETRTLAPYARFVGLKLPEGDVARGMLRTDEDQLVEIGTLSARGTPVAVQKLHVTLYKVEWRWWWDRSQESLADYVAKRTSALVTDATVSSDVQGRARWTLRVNYPQWGRYLLRVCDEEGGHCAGRTFYIDWPAWAGREREQAGPAATMLNLTADKASYQVGETAVVQLPESELGRALVTVESSAGVLEARWVSPTAGNTRVSIPVTATMAPNAYVSVTLVQPHEGKTNDRPIRLYGVIPLLVTDPSTNLKPVIATADEWKPESRVNVKIGEAQGRPMTYTLAVVDEGLLSLTGFRTPNLHEEFYRREALGVKTWDVFDEVIGAYGQTLEHLLALGGSDAAGAAAENQQQSRFPPMAQVLGPFMLKAGETQSQTITLPRYVGAVRVMVVAGSQAQKAAAFGSAEKSVYVRQPLMILPTMPRVVGPGEEILVPVSVFAMKDGVRDVSLTISPDSMFEVVGESSTRLAFTRPEEKLGLLRLRAGNRLGTSTVRFAAASGAERANAEIHIEVRSANPPSTRLTSGLVEPGKHWSTDIRPHGLSGTNVVTLEVSPLPPLNLESRMRYLIEYPHGCLEQTTSAVFPQLFLGQLLQLGPAQKAEIEDNIRAGVERLRFFQLANGGFSYWPDGSGGIATGSLEGYQLWATTYASHFLVEAERAGYAVPPAMRAGMIRNLRGAAQAWKAGEASSTLDQAYRLYVLARAGQPEIGAMNRLREMKDLQPVDRWTLASAYQHAGLAAAAKQLASGDPMAGPANRPLDYTFGSRLRDDAMVLQALVVTEQLERAQPLIRSISDALSSEQWHSTQEVAWSLLAMSQVAGARQTGVFTFDETLGGKTSAVSESGAIHRQVLKDVPQSGQRIDLANTGKGPLFVTLAVRGTAAAGEEVAQTSGLELDVRYADAKGAPVDLARLKQGEDLTVDITVRNATRAAIDNIALTQIVPSGWEIQNERLEGSAATGDREGQPRNPMDGSRAATAPRTDHVDIRDDRVLQYFRLQEGETIHFRTRVTAAYRGRYYLPGVVAEAMYDAAKQARKAGQWTEVVAR